MRKTIIGIFLVCMIAFSIAGITGGIISIDNKPVLTNKEIPKEKFDDYNAVFSKRNIDLSNGLDIKWNENKCLKILDENEVQTGTQCEYALTKENLFNGATISVTYDIKDTSEQKQVKLDNAIQDKVNFVKSVFETRDNVGTDKADENVSSGTTTFVKAKDVVEPK